jgi:hypothetical protein
MSSDRRRALWLNRLETFAFWAFVSAFFVGICLTAVFWDGG